MSAATWEPAFDSANRMVVGYNSYVAGRFIGVYDDPIGEETLPDSYLYDFSSMPYTATFDDEDNLYVGEINRGRVLVYHNPFDNPPRQEIATTTVTTPPTSQFSTTIHSVSPKPPQCVILSSTNSSETTLELEVEGIPGNHDFTIHIRRVTGDLRAWLYPSSEAVQIDATGISIDMSSVIDDHWRSRGKATLTLQLTDHDGVPLSNWSPAFVVSEDEASCQMPSSNPGQLSFNARLKDFAPYQPRPSLLEDYSQRAATPNNR